MPSQKQPKKDVPLIVEDDSWGFQKSKDDPYAEARAQEPVAKRIFDKVRQPKK